MDDDVMVPVEDDQVNPRVGNSVFDAFTPSPMDLAINPADGMPDILAGHYSQEDILPPSLNPDTLCCLAQPERHLPLGKQGQVKVYPALAKCRFYKRMKAKDTDIGRYIICRFCTHDNLKGVNGAAMDLRDTEVPFCEMRDPADPRSEDEMDKIDNEKIELGRNKQFYPVTMTPEEAASKRAAKQGQT